MGGGGGGGGAQRASVNLKSYDHKFGIICFSFQCCFASTETIRLIRDGEPRTATYAFI